MVGKQKKGLPWPRIYESRITIDSGANLTKLARTAIRKVAVQPDAECVEELVALRRPVANPIRFVDISYGLTVEEAPMVTSAVLVSDMLQFINSVEVRTKYGYSIIRSGEQLRAISLLEGRAPNRIELINDGCVVSCEEDSVRVFVAVKEDALLANDIEEVLMGHLNQNVATVVLGYATLGVDISLTLFTQVNQIKEEYGVTVSPYRAASRGRGRSSLDESFSQIIDTICPVTQKEHIVALPSERHLHKLVFWYSTPKIPYLDLLDCGKLVQDGYSYEFSQELVLTMDKIMSKSTIPMMNGVVLPIYTLTTDWPGMGNEAKLYATLKTKPLPNTTLNILLMIQEKVQTAEEVLDGWHSHISIYESRSYRGKCHGAGDPDSSDCSEIDEHEFANLVNSLEEKKSGPAELETKSVQDNDDDSVRMVMLPTILCPNDDQDFNDLLMSLDIATDSPSPTPARTEEPPP